MRKRKTSHQRFVERMGFPDDMDAHWITFGVARIGVLVLPKIRDADDIAMLRRKVRATVDEALPLRATKEAKP